MQQRIYNHLLDRAECGHWNCPHCGPKRTDKPFWRRRKRRLWKEELRRELRQESK